MLDSRPIGDYLDAPGECLVSDLELHLGAPRCVATGVRHWPSRGSYTFPPTSKNDAGMFKDKSD